MNIGQLMNKPLPTIPEDINQKILESNITLTSFENKNDILSSDILQSEVGYKKFPDGSYLVSMICPMKGITPDMINWWFWWHAQDKIRYQVWYPGEHLSISFRKKDISYFNQPKMPEFKENSQYPSERIGKIKMPLRIDFVNPETFGFSKSMMLENSIPLIVCGHVGAYNGFIMHTEMAHIFKSTDDGLLLISRFWIGKTLKNKFLRKMLLTDETAIGMANHCCIEYRNLAEILPDLYKHYR